MKSIYYKKALFFRDIIVLSLTLQALEESVPRDAPVAESVLHQNVAHDGILCKLKIELMMEFPVNQYRMVSPVNQKIELRMRFTEMGLMHFLDIQLSEMTQYKL